MTRPPKSQPVTIKSYTDIVNQNHFCMSNAADRLPFRWAVNLRGASGSASNCCLRIHCILWVVRSSLPDSFSIQIGFVRSCGRG
mmetsp:Transcript_58976/g.170522  ORF Transcript_58976/g.170522 Transcript_58976/m.170522 type:complete len:84 (-) Transcript_58976:118-369(-)